jgi:membrane fusion protein, copper/silver efflux system
MSSVIKTTLVLAAIAAAGVGGYRAGGGTLPSLETLAKALTQDAAAPMPPTGPIIYYRHPGGELVYSATPRQTDDGRAFIPVYASEDVSFDPAAAKGTAAATTAGNGERRILYYRNPMGLPDTSPVPKKDSMGMDYIPVYEGEEADDASVTLSTGKVQRTGVRTALAERTTLLRPVRAPATIKLDERRISVLATRTDAFIEDVADVTTGQSIKADTPLVRLYAPEIASAGADLITNVRSAGSVEGAVRRLKNLGVPDSVIEEMRKTGKVPLSVTLTAPRSGIVFERMAATGMMAEAGQTLFRIADTSSVWAVADVPEYVMDSIRIGADVLIRIRSLPGREFVGKVDLIYPEIEEQTRTAKVRVELANPEGLLMANMYAEAEIAAGSGAPVIAVSDSAVIDTGDRQLVFVDKGEGRFEPRDVKLGSRGGGMIEIREGVSEGERVVVSANFLIDAESNLKAALSALTPPAAQP